MATCGNEIHLYDIGTVFEVTLYECENTIDISVASTKKILFRLPDGSVLEKDGVFKTDGTDGILQYTTIEGDLIQKGTWKIQARITLPTGTWSSDTEKFKVYVNLD